MSQRVLSKIVDPSDWDIVHREGRKHQNADARSRLPPCDHKVTMMSMMSIDDETFSQPNISLLNDLDMIQQRNDPDLPWEYVAAN